MPARRQGAADLAKGDVVSRSASRRLLGLSRLEGHAGDAAKTPSGSILRQGLRERAGLHAAGRHQWPRPCQRGQRRGGRGADRSTRPARACRWRSTSPAGDSVVIDAAGVPDGKGNAHLVLVHFDPEAGRHIERGENKGQTITYANPSGVQTAGMWHGKARGSNCRAARSTRRAAARSCCSSGEQAGRCRRRPAPHCAAWSSLQPDRPQPAPLIRAAKRGKTGASLLPAPVQLFWDRRTRISPEAEVGSIRRRPVGGGLGVYEPVPDRTVSGNEVNVVGHWGFSADKKRQQCGATSPINTECSGCYRCD